MKRNPGIIKFMQWEHWPTLAFYIPLFPFFLWRSLKAGHPIFYTITNPAILFSGNGTESKFKTLDLLPKTLIPKSILFEKASDLKLISAQLKENQLEFPLIAKPDIGFRGYLVKKINSLEALLNYIKHVDENVIIQEFVPYEQELGIFYHRIPGQKKGKITSITIKKFVKIKGDGKCSVSQLIQKHNRAFLYTDLFSIIHKDKWEKVLKKDEELTLSVIGNHSKGTQFINGNHLISDQLTDFIDEICQKLEGWYYGRMDIKFEDFNEMLQGDAFKILEVNGIISEPTHIYDASHKDASYLEALRSINKHWCIMGKIAQKLHKENHISYPSIMPYVKNMFWLRSHTKKLKKLNEQNF